MSFEMPPPLLTVVDSSSICELCSVRERVDPHPLRLNRTSLLRKRVAAFLVHILTTCIASSWCTVSIVNLPAAGTASATFNGVENGSQRSIPKPISRPTGSTIWICRLLRSVQSNKLPKTSCLSWMDPKGFSVLRHPTTRPTMKISATWILDYPYFSSVRVLRAWS